MSTTDRRRDHRFSLDRRVKIRNELTGKYVAGTILNLSAGGACLLIEQPQRFQTGQRIMAGICQHPQQALLAAAELMAATVVRSEPDAEHQRLAIAFEQPQTLPAAA
jgi:c-di-GMP-binding flagellar brake protein YcgR